MRHGGVFRGFAPVGSMVILGIWLGPIGLALAQEENWKQWGCYPPHPKWGWFGESVNPDSQTGLAQESNPTGPSSGHSDPTSAAHPDWDSLPAEQTWTAQTDPTESAEAFEPASNAPGISTADPQPTAQETSKTSGPEIYEESSEVNEEASVCLSENGQPISGQQQTDPPELQGEVQSMEEYFQRYGGSSAGDPNTQMTTENTSPADSEQAEVSPEHRSEQSEPEETPAEQADQQPEDSQQIEQTPMQEGGETSDLQTPSIPPQQTEDLTEPTSTTDMHSEEEEELMEPSEEAEDETAEVQTEQADNEEDGAEEDESWEDEQDWQSTEPVETAEPSEELQSGQQVQEMPGAADPMAPETQQDHPPQQPATTSSTDTPEQSSPMEEYSEQGESAETNTTHQPQSEQFLEEARREQPAEQPQTQQQSTVPAEPTMSPEAEGPQDTSLPQEPSAEDWRRWEYEPGYGRIEGQYTPPEAEYNPPAPSAPQPSDLEGMESLPPTGLPKENLSEDKTESLPQQAEGLPEEQHFTPPPEFLPLDRYEYPEQSWQEKGQTDIRTMPAEEPSGVNPEQESSLPEMESWQQPSQTSEDSPAPTEPENNPTQPAPNEAFWADMPEAGLNSSSLPTPSSQSQQAEEGKYQWWLENPDRWAEETLPCSDRSQMEPSTSPMPGTSANQQSAGENPITEEDSFGLEGSEASPANASEEDGQQPAAGEDAQGGDQSPGSASQGGEDARGGHSTVLEGLGRSLLRLLEPWRRTVSGLWDIYTLPEWLTSRFAPDEEKLQQEGAAIRPAESLAR